MGYQNPVSDKQLRYIEALAREAGLGGDAWDHFPGWSRSKAQKKATSRDASDAIEALQAKIAKNAAREGKAIGDVVDDHVKFSTGWVKLKAEALAVYLECQQAIAGRYDDVEARREELKATGDETPWASAFRQIAGLQAKSPRELALEQIRALMTEHNITAAELTS